MEARGIKAAAKLGIWEAVKPDISIRHGLSKVGTTFIGLLLSESSLEVQKEGYDYRINICSSKNGIQGYREEVLATLDASKRKRNDAVFFVNRGAGFAAIQTFRPGGVP